MSFNRQYQRDLIGDVSGHEGGFGLVILVAASGPAFRVTLLAGTALITAAALFWDSTALLAIPGVFIAALLFALGDSATWALVRLERQTRPLSLPNPRRFRDPTVKDILRRLTIARWELAEAAAAGRKGEGCVFASASREIRDIEGEVIVIAARVEYLSRFLSKASPSDLEGDLERLKRLEERALSPATRNAYRGAIAAREGRLAVVGEIGCQREWLLASADRLLCTLESLPARAVRIQFLRLVIGHRKVCGVENEIAHLRVLVETVEEIFMMKAEEVSPIPSGRASCQAATTVKHSPKT
jgi:hypothetical protein